MAQLLQDRLPYSSHIQPNKADSHRDIVYRIRFYFYRKLNSKYENNAHKSAAGSGSYKKDILSFPASHEARCMLCIPLDEHMAEKPQTSPLTST
ncbi:hypothetical protein H5410_013210 [Solanum commersonii]|uniref:Uncharacterized protein n=1 Tax=Solanum commersonii TaxID=4109 RepID=A0A9J6ATX6_SOLCO|nr:hypothetical protein H5410_013210 [Solanum commersonii]